MNLDIRTGDLTELRNGGLNFGNSAPAFAFWTDPGQSGTPQSIYINGTQYRLLPQ